MVLLAPMSASVKGPITAAIEFAKQHSIDIAADEARFDAELEPRLGQLRGSGETVQHVTRTGADYQLTRLDYYLTRRQADAAPRLQPFASRMIAVIDQSQRTELVYWVQDAPAKQLTIHQGVGILGTGKPEGEDPTINHRDGLRLESLHVALGTQRTLPGGQFWTIEAAMWTPEPLVVSGLYQGRPAELVLDAMERYFNPDETAVTAPEGVIPVPAAFLGRYGQAASR